MDQVAETALFIVIMVELGLLVAVLGLALGRQRDRRALKLLERIVADSQRQHQRKVLDNDDAD